MQHRIMKIIRTEAMDSYAAFYLTNQKHYHGKVRHEFTALTKK